MRECAHVISMCVYECVCMNVCVFMSVRVCLFECTRVCVCVCMCGERKPYTAMLRKMSAFTKRIIAHK